MAKHRLSLRQEIGEASRKDAGKQTRRGYSNELVATARKLEKLLAKRRKQRRELRRLEEDIRHERKMLKALAGAEMGEEL
jgi:hypothetical protein